MDEKQIEKLKKLDEYLKKSELNNNLPLFEVLQDINETLKAIAEKEHPKMEMPHKMMMEMEGVEMMTIKGKDLKWEDLTPEQKAELKGDPGDDGKNYILTPKDKKEIAQSIPVPIVEKVIERTEVIKEQPIVTNEIKEVAKHKTGEEVIEDINADESEKKIKREKIEGLNEELTAIRNLPRGGGGGRQLRAVPFSFSGDGSTTSFYLPTEPSGKGWFIFAHYEGQWLQKDVHYTVAGKLFNTLGGTSTFTPDNGTVIEGFLIY